MVDLNLKAEPFLGHYSKGFKGVDLREIDDNSLVSLALPLGEESKAIKAIEAAFGIPVPDVGHSALAKNGAMRLLRLGRDQLFVVFLYEGMDSEPYIADKLAGAVYSTDQSHVWVTLEISGPSARAALERICPIDLNPDAFAIHQLARTNMEHLGTIIIRTAPDTYLLMSASSSAGSFLHAVETSIENVA